MTENTATPVAEDQRPDEPIKPKSTRSTTTGRKSGHAQEGKTSRARTGVWLTHYDIDLVGPQAEGDLGKTTPHSSEIAALRDAVKTGKTATFVEFEQSLADAVKAAQA